MTTLAQFYQLIRDEAKRGSSLDTVIPGKVRAALKLFEMIYTFKYMDRFIDLTLPLAPVSGVPNQVVQPAGFKKMQLWRIVNDDGRYSRITLVDSTDQDKLDSKKPSGYWQQGKSYFWLDSNPDRDYESEMFFTGFTQLPADGDDTTDVYPLTYYESVLVPATMVLLAPNMRNESVMGLYGKTRDECMKAAIDDDVEERQSARSESMQFGWELREHIDEAEGITQ